MPGRIRMDGYVAIFWFWGRKWNSRAKLMFYSVNIAYRNAYFTLGSLWLVALTSFTSRDPGSRHFCDDKHCCWDCDIRNNYYGFPVYLNEQTYSQEHWKKSFHDCKKNIGRNNNCTNTIETGCGKSKQWTRWFIRKVFEGLLSLCYNLHI